MNVTGIINILNKNNQSIGTGFLASSEGYILTCKHVLDVAGYKSKGEKILFKFSASNEIKSACWINFDKEEDIAVLHSQEKFAFYYSLLASERQGNKLETWGFPNKKKIGIHAFPFFEHLIENGKLIQLGNANSITHGFSGAPLLNEQGYVIGMIAGIPEDPSGRMVTIASAIPTRRILDSYPQYFEEINLPLEQLKFIIKNASQRKYEILKNRGYIYSEEEIDIDLLSNVQGNVIFNAHDIADNIANKNIYFTGDGGIGKTTVVSFLLNFLLNKSDEKSMVPIYLHATAFTLIESEWKCQNSFVEYYQYQLMLTISNSLDIKDSNSKDLSIEKSIEVEFEKESISKEYILIIDGLNETSQFIKNNIILQLKTLVSVWKNVQILVFGRDADDNELSKNEFFEHYKLVGLSRDNIEKYLNRHSIAFSLLQESLVETILNPFFLLHFCSSYDQIKSPMLENRGDILDHYFSIKSHQNVQYSEVYIIEKLHSYDPNTISEKKLVLGFVIPYIFYHFKNDGLPFQTQDYLKKLIKESLKYFYSGEFCEEVQLAFYNYFSSIIEFLPDYLLYINEKENRSIYGKDHLIKRILDYFTVFFAAFNKYTQNDQIYYLPKHQFYMDYFSAKHIQNYMSITSQSYSGEDRKISQSILYEISQIWNEDLIDFIGELCKEYQYTPQFITSDKKWLKQINESLIEKQFDILRHCFTDWAAKYIFNMIEIMRKFRKDLSGCNLSHLNLSYCTLSGLVFSRFDRDGLSLVTDFRGSQIKKNGLEFFSHRGLINDIRYLDENNIITLAQDGCVKIWDCNTGTAKQTFYGIRGNKLIIHIKNNSFITCSGENGKINEWSLSDGNLLSTISTQNKKISSICLNFDESKILTTSYDGLVELIDLKTHNIQKVGKHNSIVETAIFSSDFKKIYSCGDDGFKCWDSVSFERHFFQKKRNKELHIQFSYDNFVVMIEHHVSEFDNDYPIFNFIERYINKKTENEFRDDNSCNMICFIVNEDNYVDLLGYIEPFQEMNIESIISSKDFTQALAVCNGKVILLDIANPEQYKIKRIYQVKEFEKKEKDISSQDAIGICFQHGEEITWFHNENNKPIKISRAIFSPSEKKIVTLLDGFYSFCEWNVIDNNKIRTFPPKIDNMYQNCNNIVIIKYAVYSSDGQSIWIINNNGELKKFNMQSGCYTFFHKVNIENILQFHCSKKDVLFILGYESNNKRIVLAFDPKSFNEYKYDIYYVFSVDGVSTPIKNEPDGIILSPDGSNLYILSKYNCIHGYNTITHELLFYFESPAVCQFTCHSTIISGNCLCVLSTSCKYSEIINDKYKNTFLFLDGSTIMKINIYDNSVFSFDFTDDKRDYSFAINLTGAFGNAMYKSKLRYSVYSDKNNMFITIDYDNNIYFISLELKLIKMNILQVENINGFIMSSDEETILVYSKHIILEITIKTQTSIVFEHKDIEIKNIYFSPDNTKYIILTKQSDIVEVDFDSGVIIKKIPFDEDLHIIDCDFRSCQVDNPSQLYFLNQVGAITDSKITSYNISLKKEDFAKAYQNMLIRNNQNMCTYYFEKLSNIDPQYAYLLKGKIYHYGNCCQTINLSLAEQCYEQAITYGSKEAKSRLAFIYLKSNLNFKKVHQLFLESSDFPESCYGLGYMYWNSLSMTKPNFIEALKWYERSMSLGYENAKKKLISIYGDTKSLYYNPLKLIDLYKGIENPEAMLFLGNAFYFGKHAEQNYNTAFNCYHKVVELDDPDIETRMTLGKMYLYNRGVDEINIEQRDRLMKYWLGQAYNLIKRKIEANELSYCYELAWFYEHGIFNDIDYIYALKLHQTANNVKAAIQISKIYENGLGVDKSLLKAVDTLKNTVKDPSVFCQLASYYLNKDYEYYNQSIAFEYITKATKYNHADAFFHRGNYCMFGIGTNKNIEGAINAYQHAIDLGDNRSKVIISYYLNEKINVDQIRLCAEDHLSLGILFFEGNEIEKNYSKAVFHLSLAGDQNEPEAFTYLGKIYSQDSNNIKRNVNLAINYLLKGIYFSSASSSKTLADIYYEGRLVQRDLTLSYKYYCIAQQYGMSSLNNIILELGKKI